MTSKSVQEYKDRVLRGLPKETGVYALCDLDEVPIYVGQSTDSIRARVRRHLTSARSDVIANRQIDVWEIAFVWAWPVSGSERITALEHRLFHEFDAVSRLVNGSIPPEPAEERQPPPDRLRIQIMEDGEISTRLDPAMRYPRLIKHFESLVDYILNTQDKPHLRRALEVYFDRLSKYHHAFIGDVS